MKLNEIEWFNYSLEASVTRSDVEKKLENLISLGKPFVTDAIQMSKLENKNIDPELVLKSQTNNYYYLKLPLNIRPQNYDIRFISLDINLRSENDEAVCWSIEPQRVDKEIKVKTDVGFSTKLGLKGFEIGTKDSIGEEYVHYQPVIEAFGLGETNSAWEMRSVKGKNLSGIMLFHMIIEVVKGKTGIAQVQVKADVFSKNMLWSYHAIKSDNSTNLLEIPLSIK